MATTTGSKRLLDISADAMAASNSMTYGGLNVATENWVSTQIANLVSSAPATLDTLNELAAALGDDPNFATTMTNALAGKLATTHDMTLTLNGDASGSATFTNMGNATLTVTVANDSHTHDGRYYTESEVDTLLAGKLSTSGKAADSNLLDGLDSSRFLYTSSSVFSGDWNTLTDSDYEIQLREVQNITSGAHSNYPTGVYTYGSVLAWQLASATFALYASHTGDLVFQTGWNNDGYSGWREIWHTGNFNPSSYLTTSGKAADSNLLDGIDSSAFLRSNTADTASGLITFTGGVKIQGGSAGDAAASELIFDGSNSPQIKFRDSDTGEDDFYIHVNSNNFYILADRDNSDGWDGQHPMQLEADTNSAYFFGNKLNSAAYAATSAFDAAGSAAAVDTRIDNEVLPAIDTKADASHTHSAADITSGTLADARIASAANWNSAYNNYITGLAFSGTTTKTLTLTQRDGGTISASFTDLSGAGGDGNDFLTGVTRSGNTLTFAVSNQTNPTYTFGSAAWAATTDFDSAGAADAVNDRIDTEVLPAIDTKLDASANPITGATVSNDTITFTRSDNTTFNVTTSDANTNYYLNGITKSGNTLTFAVNGTTNQTYTFGSNAFNSTTIPTNNNQLTNGAGYITGVGWADIIGDQSEIQVSGFNNDAGYITGYTVTGSDVTTALGYTPYQENTALSATTGTFSGDVTVNGNQVITAASNADVKFSVWSGSTYGIGMTSGVTYGGLNDYAMTFCMNNDTDRGFWWGYSGQSKSAGAMSLTTAGVLTVASSITAGGDITAFSDIRVKENIKDLENSLDKVTQLRGVSYNKIGSEEKSIGVIAQEIQEVLPEVVREGQDGMLSVAYGNITAVLIEAIKEQQEIISQLEERIVDLENRM